MIAKINEIAEANKSLFGGVAEAVPDWFIADKMNEPASGTTFLTIQINCADIRQILSISGDWSKMVAAVEANGTSAAVVTACNIVMDSLTLNDAIQDNNVPTFINNIATLSTAGVISAESKNKIDQRKERKKTYAEEINQQVTARTVGLARGGK
jgi:hypothetical protein